ncbi:MAG: LytR C-terminal domain-containing protein [Candidatus Cloacimonadales bacterium]|nr:LytR C-terminal domain-containing protein [Candidatus Cloacimonadales bacterium]
MKNNLSPVNRKALLVALCALSGLILIGYFLFFQRSEKQEIAVETRPTSVKLAILNGCGVDGAATDVKEYFINKNAGNIDIISWRNVDRDMFIYGKSIIVIKREDEEKLNYIMNLTGITRKIYALDPNSIEDMQIILGNDYKEYFK